MHICYSYPHGGGGETLAKLCGDGWSYQSFAHDHDAAFGNIMLANARLFNVHISGELGEIGTTDAKYHIEIAIDWYPGLKPSEWMCKRYVVEATSDTLLCVQSDMPIRALGRFLIQNAKVLGIPIHWRNPNTPRARELEKIARCA